jgi:hypothetical protein
MGFDSVLVVHLLAILPNASSCIATCCVSPQVLRSQQYMVRRIRAVTTIQAWWRGHRVRTSPELARQRQQHSAQREAARLLQEQARKVPTDRGACCLCCLPLDPCP